MGNDIKHGSKRDTPPSLTIDWDAYLPYLEDEDIPDDQKRELIATLWNIMTAFADLGFGIHPVQQACGELEESSVLYLPDMLSSNKPDPSDEPDPALQSGRAKRKESR